MAFTQIPGEYFNFADDLRNSVFINDIEGDLENFPFKDCLIVNPQVLYCHGHFLSIEGCGSILDGRVGYLMIRPKQVIVDGWVWSPKKRRGSLERMTCLNRESAVLTHEVDHLNGLTALNFIEKMVDFRKLRNPYEWRKLGWNVVGERPSEILRKVYTRWIVPEDGQEWSIVDSMGNLLERFITVD